MTEQEYSTLFFREAQTHQEPITHAVIHARYKFAFLGHFWSSPWSTWLENRFRASRRKEGLSLSQFVLVGVSRLTKRCVLSRKRYVQATVGRCLTWKDRRGCGTESPCTQLCKASSYHSCCSVFLFFNEVNVHRDTILGHWTHIISQAVQSSNIKEELKWFWIIDTPDDLLFIIFCALLIVLFAQRELNCLQELKVVPSDMLQMLQRHLLASSR